MDDIWQLRRPGWLRMLEAQERTEQQQNNEQQPVVGAVHVVYAASQQALLLSGITEALLAQRPVIEGRPFLPEGERVLLTGQSDARENGVWVVGGGATTPAMTPHPGMLVHSTASGCLFCCTAFSPAQGGVFSLVTAPCNDELLCRVDPTLSSGDPGSLTMFNENRHRLRGLVAGPGLSLGPTTQGGGNRLLLRLLRPVCILRATDVLATSGALVLESDSAPLSSGAPWNCGGPALRFRAQPSTTATGEALFVAAHMAPVEGEMLPDLSGHGTVPRSKKNGTVRCRTVRVSGWNVGPGVNAVLRVDVMDTERTVNGMWSGRLSLTALGVFADVTLQPLLSEGAMTPPGTGQGRLLVRLSVSDTPTAVDILLVSLNLHHDPPRTQR